MARKYYYDFAGNISNDPSLSPEQISELEKHIEIRDPLNGGKVIEGVISFDAQNHRLDKWKMFKGQKLLGNDGREEVEIIVRLPPQPDFEAVKVSPPADGPKAEAVEPKAAEG